MPRKVKVNGVVHSFPDDATDAEIAQALDSTQAPKAASTPAAQPKSLMTRIGDAAMAGLDEAGEAAKSIFSSIPDFLPGHEMDLGQHMLGPQIEQGMDARERAKRGDKTGSMFKSVAAGVPFAGPMAGRIYDRAEAGEDPLSSVARGAVDVGTLALPEAIPHVAKAIPGMGRGLEAVADWTPDVTPRDMFNHPVSSAVRKVGKGIVGGAGRLMQKVGKQGGMVSPLEQGTGPAGFEPAPVGYPAPDIPLREQMVGPLEHSIGLDPTEPAHVGLADQVVEEHPQVGPLEHGEGPSTFTPADVGYPVEPELGPEMVSPLEQGQGIADFEPATVGRKLSPRKIKSLQQQLEPEGPKRPGTGPGAMLRRGAKLGPQMRPGPSAGRERILYHGTSADAVEPIMREGLRNSEELVGANSSEADLVNMTRNPDVAEFYANNGADAEGNPTSQDGAVFEIGVPASAIDNKTEGAHQATYDRTGKWPANVEHEGMYTIPGEFDMVRSAQPVAPQLIKRVRLLDKVSEPEGPPRPGTGPGAMLRKQPPKGPFYHGTPFDNLASIGRDGIKPQGSKLNGWNMSADGTTYMTPDIADAEEFAGGVNRVEGMSEGKAIIKVDPSNLDPDLFGDDPYGHSYSGSIPPEALSLERVPEFRPEQGIVPIDRNATRSLQEQLRADLDAHGESAEAERSKEFFKGNKPGYDPMQGSDFMQPGQGPPWDDTWDNRLASHKEGPMREGSGPGAALSRRGFLGRLGKGAVGAAAGKLTEQVGAPDALAGQREVVADAINDAREYVPNSYFDHQQKAISNFYLDQLGDMLSKATSASQVKAIRKMAGEIQAESITDRPSFDFMYDLRDAAKGEFKGVLDELLSAWRDNGEELVPTHPKLKDMLAEAETKQHALEETYRKKAEAEENTPQAKAGKATLDRAKKAYKSEQLNSSRSKTLHREDHLDDVWWQNRMRNAAGSLTEQLDGTDALYGKPRPPRKFEPEGPFRPGTGPGAKLRKGAKLSQQVEKPTDEIPGALTSERQAEPYDIFGGEGKPKPKSDVVADKALRGAGIEPRNFDVENIRSLVEQGQDEFDASAEYLWDHMMGEPAMLDPKDIAEHLRSGKELDDDAFMELAKKKVVSEGKPKGKRLDTYSPQRLPKSVRDRIEAKLGKDYVWQGRGIVTKPNEGLFVTIKAAHHKPLESANIPVTYEELRLIEADEERNEGAAYHEAVEAFGQEEVDSWFKKGRGKLSDRVKEK